MCLAVRSLTVLFYLVFSISATPSSVCNHPSVLWLSPFYLYTNNECQLTNFQQVHQVTTCNQRRPQTCLTENLTGPLPNIKSPQKAKLNTFTGLHTDIQSNRYYCGSNVQFQNNFQTPQITKRQNNYIMNEHICGKVQ